MNENLKLCISTVLFVLFIVGIVASLGSMDQDAFNKTPIGSLMNDVNSNPTCMFSNDPAMCIQFAKMGRN